MTIYDEFKTFALIPLCGGIGIVLAMIVEVLYDRGLLIDEYVVGTLTLANLQSIIVIVFILLGIGLGVLSRK